jgi:L,D-transpeptidase ErfK/SrfK
MQRNLRAALLKSIHFSAAAGLLGGCSLLTQQSEPVAPPVVVAVPARPDPAAPRLEALESRHFALAPQQELVGETQVIFARYENTFSAIGRQYNLGYEEMRRANPGVDQWLPGEGTPIYLPTQTILPEAPHQGIVVNVPAMRLYYFTTEKPKTAGEPEVVKVSTHPVGIGTEGWATPFGEAKVMQKAKDPTWYVPASVRKEHAERGDPLPSVVPPGPDNPLGKHAMRLGLPGYLIHGTNRPSGVGMRVTHGCMRMFPEDIEALYKTVPVGTAVNIVNQPVKIGWTADGTLYLESHPALMESGVDGENVVDAAAEAAAPIQESPLTSLMRAYIAATEERRVEFDWNAAERVAQLGSGVPEAVSVAGSAVPLTTEIAAAEPDSGD